MQEVSFIHNYRSTVNIFKKNFFAYVIVIFSLKVEKYNNE